MNSREKKGRSEGSRGPTSRQQVTTIEYRSSDGRFSVQIERARLHELLDHCSIRWPNETGGILIGRYTPSHRTALVTRIEPPPPDSRFGPPWFFRGVLGLTRKLARLWNRPEKSREYYLGEWHLHPLGLPSPSSKDHSEMQAIAKSKSYSCPEPILILVGGKPPDWLLEVFVFLPGEVPVRLLRTRPQ